MSIENTIEQLTWNTPSLVENVKEDENGLITFQLRVGRSLMLSARHEKTYSDEKPTPDEALLFRIRPSNRIGLTDEVSINALTDEVRLTNVFWQPTVPTATQYREAIGQERLIHSATIENPNQQSGQPKYLTNRVYLKIP